MKKRENLCILGNIYMEADSIASQKTEKLKFLFFSFLVLFPLFWWIVLKWLIELLFSWKELAMVQLQIIFSHDNCPEQLITYKCVFWLFLESGYYDCLGHDTRISETLFIIIISKLSDLKTFQTAFYNWAPW